MKKTNSFILAVLAITIAFTACKGSKSATKTESAAGSDSAATKMVTTHDASHANLEANKKIATGFVQALMGDKDSTAIDKYVADHVIQHNPMLQDGKVWLKNALRPFLENPNVEKTKVNIEMTSAEGDLVWLLIKDVAPNGKVFARVSIFRIENGKIAEAWKVAEAVPKESENNNTMF